MESKQNVATEKAVQVERERCIECVESQMGLAGEDALVRSLLTRIANLIRSGEPPTAYDPFKER